MTSESSSPLSFPRAASTRGIAVLISSSALLAVPVSANETEFVGPAGPLEPNVGYLFSNPDHWTQGVPGPGDTVLVEGKTGEDEEPLPFFGPALDIDATFQNLTLGDRTGINNAFAGPNPSLFVSGTTKIGSDAAVVNFAGIYSLGTLDITNYDPSSRTVFAGPAYYLGDREGTGMGIMEFRGADIVTNKATFAIYGTNCFLRDQNGGLNAFRNLAVNDGTLIFNDGYGVTTNGNFTNNGGIHLNLQSLEEGSPSPALRVSGNLTNNGSIDLYARSTLTVSGGLSGTGEIRILGLPVTCAVTGIWDVNGGLLNLGPVAGGGSGIDSFTLKATNLNVGGGAVVQGNGKIEAIVTITSGTFRPGNSAGQIEVEGDLTLETGATLEMEIAGSTHDRIIQSGGDTGTTLGGQLKLATIEDFDDKVLYDSSYEILSSDLPLAGSFTNVASGARLTTMDGTGSFQVNYGPGSAAPDKIVLSNFQAVIVPQTYMQWLLGQDLDPEQDGPEDDPNGDGIENLEAFFRGVSASGAITPAPVTAVVEEGMLKVSVRAPKSVRGVIVTSRTTSGFVMWDSGPVPTVIDASPTRDIYQVTIPVASQSRFVQFRFKEEEQ